MTVSNEGSRVRIAWPDGQASSFYAVWLRDNCPCPECLHPSGQRLLDTRTIADDIALTRAEMRDGFLETTFNDAHTSRFDAPWLRAHDEPPAPAPKPLWGAEIEPPTGRWQDVRAGGEPLRRWLSAVDELGFALLTGCGTEPGTVFRVVETFGYVRQTNYGRLFDVRSVVEATNLAYTGLGLGAHTDNPYREPTPTLQLLHCLSSSASGGESTLVDGFRVAADLRSKARRDFDLLVRHPVLFRYRDADTELDAEVPVISLDARGGVCAIHFNTRSTAPFRLDGADVEPYYAAYRTFGHMLEAPEYQLRVALAPGDLVIVDNLRVLHGRTAFSDAGERHLQGCYADRDGLRSRLAVLSRNRSPIDEIFATFRERGTAAYLGEPVSLTEHMLQSARAAELDGAGPPLVAAALLHDYGHLIHHLPEDAAEHGLDTRHEDVAFDFLSQHFGPEIVEPIRMHVAAKRYLCAVDPSYLEALSPASIVSLELQGGPFDHTELTDFESSPHAENAVRLRRYDDAAKTAGAETPDLEHYRSVLEAVRTR
jgi:gamma-butyrobetaine dioxygenase